MTTGIYCLQFGNINKVYIGQSINIERRFVQHKRHFLQNLSSQKLQEAYNTLGIPKLKVLVICNKEELDYYETKCINLYNSYIDGFNSTSGGSTGTQLSGPEHGQAKFTRDQIIDVFKYLLIPGMPYKLISKLTNVTEGIIAAISRSRAHTWLADEFPEEYVQLQNINRKEKVIFCKVKDKNNKVHIIDNNLTDFCNANSLNKNGITRMLSGERKSYLGWKLVSYGN